MTTRCKRCPWTQTRTPCSSYPDTSLRKTPARRNCRTNQWRLVFLLTYSRYKWLCNVSSGQGWIQDFGQGAQQSFDPRRALSPKFAQNCLKTAWFWKNLGAGGPGLQIPHGSASEGSCNSMVWHGRLASLCSMVLGKINISILHRGVMFSCFDQGGRYTDSISALLLVFVCLTVVCLGHTVTAAEFSVFRNQAQFEQKSKMSKISTMFQHLHNQLKNWFQQSGDHCILHLLSLGKSARLFLWKTKEHGLTFYLMFVAGKVDCDPEKDDVHRNQVHEMFWRAVVPLKNLKKKTILSAENSKFECSNNSIPFEEQINKILTKRFRVKRG